MLASIEIANFRCIRQARLEFDSRVTAVCGANGSGKSSLLEAIFFLGHGRSFRTNVREHLLARGTDFLRVVGWVSSGSAQLALGAEFSAGTTQLRVGGRPARSSIEMAGALPLQIIDPGVHRVIEEGSARRRRLLDWGVFHVKHDFMLGWRRYQRALEQRNAALRGPGSQQHFDVWEEELELAASVVHAARADYMSGLRPYFQTLVAALFLPEVRVDYYPGWTIEETLSGALARSRERDLRLKLTTLGAHRADLRFKVAGRPARECVSRGEQKLLAMAFILSQVRYLTDATAIRSCLLVDDPAAELDVDNLGKLLEIIAALHCQLIVTAVNPAALEPLSAGRMFHVKQGDFHSML